MTSTELTCVCEIYEDGHKKWKYQFVEYNINDHLLTIYTNEKQIKPYRKITLSENIFIKNISGRQIEDKKVDYGIILIDKNDYSHFKILFTSLKIFSQFYTNLCNICEFYGIFGVPLELSLKRSNRTILNSTDSRNEKEKSEKEKIEKERSEKERNEHFSKIPLPILRAIEYLLLDDHLETSGLFRISAQGTSLQEIREIFDSGKDLKIEQFNDPHVASGLIKLYLRSLPDSLIPSQLTNEFLDIVREEEVEEQVKQFKIFLQKIPELNKYIFRYLFCFLTKVKEKSEINKMVATNIAIVFAPNLLFYEDSADALMLSKNINDLVAKIVERYEEIFGPMNEFPGPFPPYQEMESMIDYETMIGQKRKGGRKIDTKKSDKFERNDKLSPSPYDDTNRSSSPSVNSSKDNSTKENEDEGFIGTLKNQFAKQRMARDERNIMKKKTVTETQLDVLNMRVGIIEKQVTAILQMLVEMNKNIDSLCIKNDIVPVHENPEKVTFDEDKRLVQQVIEEQNNMIIENNENIVESNETIENEIIENNENDILNEKEENENLENVQEKEILEEVKEEKEEEINQNDQSNETIQMNNDNISETSEKTEQIEVNETNENNEKIERNEKEETEIKEETKEIEIEEKKIDSLGEKQKEIASDETVNKSSNSIDLKENQKEGGKEKNKNKKSVKNLFGLLSTNKEGN